MKASEMKFEDIMNVVCDGLLSITDEGNYTILQVTHTPNSKTYQVSVFPNKSKPYDDDNTRDK